MGWNHPLYFERYWVGRVDTFVPINFGMRREEDEDWDMTLWKEHKQAQRLECSIIPGV